MDLSQLLSSLVALLMLDTKTSGQEPFPCSEAPPPCPVSPHPTSPDSSSDPGTRVAVFEVWAAVLMLLAALVTRGSSVSAALKRSWRTFTGTGILSSAKTT